MRVGRIMYYSELRRVGKIVDLNEQEINFYFDTSSKIPCINDLVVFIIQKGKNGLEAKLIGNVTVYSEYDILK